MKKLYECEITRSNISPRQFFTYCKNQMKKRTGVDLAVWVESFEDWTNEADDTNSTWYHDDWDEPVTERCKTLAYDWHMFLGKAYNFIMEFQFDDKNKGFGYMYVVEFER